MAKSNDIKPLDVTQPSDIIKPVELQPIKPERVDVKKPPDPVLNVSTAEALHLWFKYWIIGKSKDALAGLPADLLPPIRAVDNIVKIGLLILIVLIVSGGGAWILSRFF